LTGRRIERCERGEREKITATGVYGFPGKCEISDNIAEIEEMKVLQINSVSGYGSTGRIVREIGEKIVASGGESYVAYGRKPEWAEKEAIRIGGNWSCLMHGLRSRLTDGQGWGSEKATFDFIAGIRHIRPDIIHLHNLHGYYLNIRVLFEFLAEAGLPVIWTLHDCWPLTGHCTHFAYQGCEKWLTGCGGCPQLRSYPASWTDRSAWNYRLKSGLFAAVRDMTVVPVSYWLGNIVRKSVLQQYPVEVIQNGIDTEVFRPVIGNIRERYGIGERFMILGVTNDWCRQKGLEDFRRLNEWIDSRKYVIVLVGLTAAQIRDLPREVIAVGRTKDVRELAAFYSAADVFVNLTWEDTFPTTNLEALACATPVITYRTGGSVEAVTPETGFVVDQGDLRALCRILDALYVNGVAPYREACRLRAETCFEKSICYERYIQLYNQVIHKNV